MMNKQHHKNRTAVQLVDEGAIKRKQLFQTTNGSSSGLKGTVFNYMPPKKQFVSLNSCKIKTDDFIHFKQYTPTINWQGDDTPKPKVSFLDSYNTCASKPPKQQQEQSTTQPDKLVQIKQEKVLVKSASIKNKILQTQQGMMSKINLRPCLNLNRPTLYRRQSMDYKSNKGLSPAKGSIGFIVY